MGTLKRGHVADPTEGAAEAPLALLNRETYFERAKKARARTNPDASQPAAFAMYSSLVNGIVTDPELMVVPFDDHAIVRGHAIFDTATLARGRVYRLGIHLDRLFASAKIAKLKLPFGLSEEETRQRMTEIVCQTCAASGQRDGMIRFILSAGPGNFGVTPEALEPAFYCVVVGGIKGLGGELKAIDEMSVPVSKVPMKPPLLATCKSNNYMLNCMTAMSAKEEGGFMGILVRDDGTIAESAVLNVGFVTSEQELLTPCFGDILCGTTVRRVMELARAHLVGDGKLLKDVRQEVIPLTKAKASTEVFLCGGDTHLLPVGRWDKQPVGDGKVGPVARELARLLAEDRDRGEGQHISVDYNKFAKHE